MIARRPRAGSREAVTIVSSPLLPRMANPDKGGPSNAAGGHTLTVQLYTTTKGVLSLPVAFSAAGRTVSAVKFAKVAVTGAFAVTAAGRDATSGKFWKVPAPYKSIAMQQGRQISITAGGSAA